MQDWEREQMKSNNGPRMSTTTPDGDVEMGRLNSKLSGFTSTSSTEEEEHAEGPPWRMIQEEPD